MEEKLQTHGIKFKDKFGYALGDMGGVLTFSLISSFLNMFYTDVLGISAANITILMIVARVWDAINDRILAQQLENLKMQRSHENGVKKVAKEMLKDGFDIEKIAKLTGIEESEIIDLKD